MKRFWLVALVLSGAFLLAQDNSADTGQKNAKGQETIRGCVSRSNGDYTLMKEHPAVTYELQAGHHIRLRHYLGKRVEVTGSESPSLSTSSDSMARQGNAAPVTLNISSIKVLNKDCSVPDVSR
ncbi:MAG: hypothetical protein WBV55_08115 [Candidatus Sulfotelmatobacter sp.]